MNKLGILWSTHHFYYCGAGHLFRILCDVPWIRAQSDISVRTKTFQFLRWRLKRQVSLDEMLNHTSVPWKVQILSPTCQVLWKVPLQLCKRRRDTPGLLHSVFISKGVEISLILWVLVIYSEANPAALGYSEIKVVLMLLPTIPFSLSLRVIFLRELPPDS